MTDTDQHYLAADMRRCLEEARRRQGTVPARDVRRWLKVLAEKPLATRSEGGVEWRDDGIHSA